MTMKCYIVTVQVFAAGGDDIEVTAHNEIEAEEKAKEIVETRFNEGYYKDELSLSEICINSTALDPSDADRDYPEPIDPAFREWMRMGDVQHPLEEDTLILSIKGESDEGEYGTRATGPMAVGVIDMVQRMDFPQGWAYGVHFPSHNCVYVTVDEGEYDTARGLMPNDYFVAVG